MTDFDRLTTDSWTIAFPCDWEDQSDGETTYFESPDGSKGFYVSLWNMGEAEERTASQLIDVFIATELDGLLGGSDQRELLSKGIKQIGNLVVCNWDTLAQANCYRVAGKILARGKQVLRATFHDYDCEDYVASLEHFSHIIGSLELRDGLVGQT